MGRKKRERKLKKSKRSEYSKCSHLRFQRRKSLSATLSASYENIQSSVKIRDYLEETHCFAKKWQRLSTGTDSSPWKNLRGNMVTHSFFDDDSLHGCFCAWTNLQQSFDKDLVTSQGLLTSHADDVKRRVLSLCGITPSETIYQKHFLSRVSAHLPYSASCALSQLFQAHWLSQDICFLERLDLFKYFGGGCEIQLETNIRPATNVEDHSVRLCRRSQSHVYLCTVYWLQHETCYFA